MIRPITCVTFLLACGTGLYLYQAKHRAYLLDTEIEQVVRETDAVREQTRILRAEWTLLDQPERLQRLATSLLNLQPTKPAQFVSLADLDSRLPPIPPPPEAAPAVVAQSSTDADQSQTEATAPGPAPSGAPTGTEPVAKPAASAAPAMQGPKLPPHPAEHPASRMVEQSRPRPAEHPSERVATHSSQPAPRTAEAVPYPVAEPARGSTSYVRATLPRPVPVPGLRPYPMQPPRPGSFVTPVAQAGGSMLGMAHSAPPPPAPMPVAPSVSRWGN